MNYSYSFVANFLRKKFRSRFSILLSLLIFFAAFIPQRSFAHILRHQLRTVPEGYVRGKVITENGEPLPGVSVHDPSQRAHGIKEGAAVEGRRVPHGDQRL